MVWSRGWIETLMSCSSLFLNVLHLTAAEQNPQAVKSVLVMAGSLKRGYPDVDEDLTLIRALVDSNVPKFLADDLPLFAAIVKVVPLGAGCHGPFGNECLCCSAIPSRH